MGVSRMSLFSKSCVLFVFAQVSRGHCFLSKRLHKINLQFFFVVTTSGISIQIFSSCQAIAHVLASARTSCKNGTFVDIPNLIKVSPGLSDTFVATLTNGLLCHCQLFSARHLF